MQKRNSYFIWLDKSFSILAALYIFTMGIDSMDQYIIVDDFIWQGFLKVQGFHILIITIFVFCSLTYYKVKNNKLNGVYIIKPLDISRINSISISKKLCFHYTNKKGVERKFNMYFPGLRNNREKYTQLLAETLKIANEDGIIIEQSPEQILDEIYANRMNPITAADDKPLKTGGWLLIWKLYMVYLIVAGAISLYKQFPYFIEPVSTGFEVLYLLYKAIGISGFIILLIYIATLCVSMGHKKWSVKAIITLYFINAFVSMLYISFVVYIYNPMYELSSISIAVVIISTLLKRIFSALLYRRYFTHSIRVQNTYIK